MGLTLNFRNILDLYGLKAGNLYQESFSLAENVDLFLSVFDINDDGIIDKSAEFKAFLKTIGLPESMADNIFAAYAGGNDQLTKTEIETMIASLDNNNDGKLDFKESLEFYNTSANLDLDADTLNYQQYNSFFAATKSAITGIDTGTVDQKLDDSEYAAYLVKNNLQGRFGDDFVNLFDKGNDGIDFEEFIAKLIQWDKNNDGSVDYTNADPFKAEGTEFYDLYKQAVKITSSSYIPQDFNNIMNIFNISVNDPFNGSNNTVASNANSFVNIIDANGDGFVAKAEYESFLENIGLSSQMSNNLFNENDSNSDNLLSLAELTTVMSSFDANSDNSINFEEGLTFLNHYSNANISIDMSEFSESSEAFNYYSTHFESAKSLILNYDMDEDGKIDSSQDEAGIVLEAFKIMPADEYSAGYVNLYDSNGDGAISFEEYLKKHLDWDLNRNGSLDMYNSTAPEAAEYYNFLPEVYKTASDDVELMAQNLILAVDQYDNLKIEKEEFATFMAQNYGLSGQMAEDLITLYDSNTDGSVDFTELTAAYRAFDSITVDAEGNESGGADGKLSYKEMIAFQNSLTPIDIDPELVSIEQYSGLYNLALSLTSSLDENKNGEVSVEEYRTVLKQMYEQAGLEVPYYAAENFIRIFDQDKNGTVNVIEAINKYAEYDTNKDGVVSAEEAADLNAKLENKKLYNSVNDEIMDKADKDNNNKLSVDEYSAYLKENMLPELLADDAFAMFDLNADGQLSRLELMEAYSRYDNTAENTAYIESQTGVPYVLYTGDADGKLDADEKLRMYQDLAALDYAGVDFNIDSAKINQYNSVTASLEEFINQIDFDKNGLVSSVEYQKHLEEQGLPDYFADNAIDNAIVNFDLNNDDSLDFIEWVKVNLDYDTNGNGELELDEVLQMCGDLSGVTLTVDSTNIDQHELLYDKANVIMQNYDINGDRIITANELEDYMKQYELPAVYAQDMVDAYNTGINADAGLDVIELLKVYVDFDANKNGILEFEEEFAMYDNMSAVNLGINQDNANQYKKINDVVSEIIGTYDLNLDKKLDTNEIAKFFKAQGMSEDSVTEALAAYDVEGGPDNALDVLEWMKMYYDFDANKDGILNNQEDLALFDTLAGTGLNPNPANADQLGKIQTVVDSAIQKLDMDQDKKLSVAEMQKRMKELGLPDYIANEFINNASGNLAFTYDQDGDGKVDKLEYMKALVDFDANNNGVLEFNEEMAMYSGMSGANLNPSADEVTQYSTIYNQVKALFAKEDSVTDRILTAEEFENYFTDLQLPAYMSAEAVTMYDINGDGGLDIYEWMKSQVAFDVNKSGKLEFNEQMSLMGIIADPDIPIDPNTMNVNQVTALFNYSKNYVAYLDKDGDKKFSVDEYATYLKTIGLSDNVAADIVASQDLNGDLGIDIMEWLNTNLVFDANHSGVIDFNETMALYQATTGIEFNTDNSNLTQHQALYNYAVSNINVYGAFDKKLSAEEFKTWFSVWGMTEDQANQIISNYDQNADGGMDALEFTKALIDNDTNKNAKWDSAEIMNFFDAALPAIDLGGVDDTNVTQKWALYKYAFDNVIAQDKDYNKELSATELKTWFTTWGMTEDQASQIISAYDLNSNGDMDALEFTKALIDNDTNTNGAWDSSEIMNFFDSALPAIDLGGVDDTNVMQKWALYKYAFDSINAYDKDYNKELSTTEMKNWFATWGMTEDQANQIISNYDLNFNGDMDALEFTKALIGNDTNTNGAWDSSEIMNFFDSALPAIDLGGVDDTNVTQKWALYNSGMSLVNAQDIDKNKALNQAELEIYFKSLGLPKYMAIGAIEKLDINGDLSVDALEFAQAYMDFDANKTGALEFNELTQYYETIAEEGLQPGVGSVNAFNFNPTIDNLYQLNKLYTDYTNFIKTKDVNNDRIISVQEYTNHLLALKYTNAATLASNAVALYDKNNDGGLDAFEWMDALLSFDLNGNGIIEGAEGTNYINSIS